MRSPLPHRALLVAAALVGLAAREPRAQVDAPTPSSDDLLGAIDFAPARSDLDASMTAALDELVAIVADDTADPGRRLHAIRALSQYPGDQAKNALLGLIAQNSGARAGTDLLHLRAAIEALAEIGGPAEVSVIASFLEIEGATPFDCLDLRATAARALGVLGSVSAVAPLRARQNVEQSAEVKFAITEALRAILGGS